MGLLSAGMPTAHCHHAAAHSAYALPCGCDFTGATPVPALPCAGAAASGDRITIAATDAATHHIPAAFKRFMNVLL